MYHYKVDHRYFLVQTECYLSSIFKKIEIQSLIQHFEVVLEAAGKIDFFDNEYDDPRISAKMLASLMPQCVTIQNNFIQEAEPIDIYEICGAGQFKLDQKLIKKISKLQDIGSDRILKSFDLVKAKVDKIEKYDEISSEQVYRQFFYCVTNEWRKLAIALHDRAISLTDISLQSDSDLESFLCASANKLTSIALEHPTMEIIDQAMELFSHVQNIIFYNPSKFRLRKQI